MIEWLARLTVALLALQALALLVRFVGWLDSFTGGRRRRRVVAENQPENYALWALAVVVVAVSSAVASWALH